jgi:hypothetical protein
MALKAWFWVLAAEDLSESLDCFGRVHFLGRVQGGGLDKGGPWAKKGGKAESLFTLAITEQAVVLLERAHCE